MGVLPPPPPPNLPRQRRQRPTPHSLQSLLLLLLCNMAAGGHVGCDMNACTRAYDVSLNNRGLAGPEGSAAFCGVLYDFGICMFNIRSYCRGNIHYHTSNSMLVHLRNKYDCARRLEEATGSPTGVPMRGKHSRTTSTPSPTPAQTVLAQASAAPTTQCSYHGNRAFKHCALFGDPHLKTFEGSMQTCRVQGAWPLIDNPYLAVQVTNEHVLPGSPATATTKVTVLVKSSSTPCTTQKTYEATADAPLPYTFIDATNKSGPGESVVIKHQESKYGAWVEIYISYIETTVIVRKVGHYLAFSARMPEELVEDNGLQLCVQGCPLSERLDLAAVRGTVLNWTDALARCVSKSAPSPSPSQDTNEVEGDLTDQYLDWCVFDLMTTGKDDFVLAARAAHRDTLDLDPAALRNRTRPVWDVGPRGSWDYSGASRSTERCSWQLIASIVATLALARFAL